MIGPAPLLFLLYRITAHCQAFCPQKPPLTEGKVSTGVGAISKMMCRCAAMVGAQGMTERSRAAAAFSGGFTLRRGLFSPGSTRWP